MRNKYKPKIRINKILICDSCKKTDDTNEEGYVISLDSGKYIKLCQNCFPHFVHACNQMLEAEKSGYKEMKYTY